MSLDTDTDVVDDDEVDFSDPDVDLDDDDLGLDDELDFDNVAPPDKNYEIEIMTVSFRNGPGKKDPSVKTFGLSVRAKLVDPDGDWNGHFVNPYIWLGNDAIDGNGRAKMKQLAEACGVPCSGKMKISDFLPQKMTIGKNVERVLTAFTEARCAAYVKTETKVDDEGNERTNQVLSGWMTVDAMDSAKEAAEAFSEY